MKSSPTVLTYHDMIQNAHDLLQILPPYTLEQLKAAFRRAALTYHPDRSTGNSIMFQTMIDAFKVLVDKYKKEHPTERSMENLQYQRSEEEVPHYERKKITPHVFNRLFEEHRIHQNTDQGYGDWLKEEIPDSSSWKQNFSGDFNSRFDQWKRLQHATTSSSLMTYQTPSTSSSYDKDTLSYTLLGEDNIHDFSGKTSSLSFSDVKQAHTTSAMIDTSQYSSNRSPSMSVEQLHAFRNDPNTLIISEEEKQRLALQQQHDLSMEEKRRMRVYEQDRVIETQFNHLQRKFLE